MAHAAVEGIHEQLFHTLELLRTSMHLRSCVLLWCEQNGSGKISARCPPRIVVKEMATTSEYAAEERVLNGPGLLTSLIADPKPVRLHALKGKRLPPYYQGPEPVTDLQHDVGEGHDDRFAATNAHHLHVAAGERDRVGQGFADDR